jgi:hypothetical protein
MTKKIRVTVELPWATVSDIVEYYDLPDDWDTMTPKQRDTLLEDMGRTELENTGVGYGASVVDVAEAAL